MGLRSNLQLFVVVHFEFDLEYVELVRWTPTPQPQGRGPNKEEENMNNNKIKSNQQQQWRRNN